MDIKFTHKPDDAYGLIGTTAEYEDDGTPCCAWLTSPNTDSHDLIEETIKQFITEQLLKG
jgi:hypothetical protein